MEKMTYVGALALAIEAVKDPAVKEKLIALKAQQEKRAATRKPRVNKAKLELAGRVAMAMVPGTAYRATELADFLDVTTQKLTPALGFLVEAGRVIRTVEKRVARYQLVEFEDEEEEEAE